MNTKKCKAMNRMFGFNNARTMRRDIRRGVSAKHNQNVDWVGLMAYDRAKRAAKREERSRLMTKSMMP